MPLNATEAKIVKDTITLDKKVILKEGDKVVLKVTNKKDKEVLGEGTFEYTVKAFETPVPTKIAELKATIEGKEDATSVVALDKVTLQADVRDQFNSPVATDKAEVRYVVKEGKELLAAATKDSSEPAKATNLGSDNATLDVKNGKVDFQVEKPGKLVIEAFNKANGAKAVYEVEVGAKELTDLTYTGNLTGNNNEEIKSEAAITANPGAALTADMIQFRITDDKGNPTSDVDVKAQLRGGKDEAKANDIIIVAKSSKAGTYKVIPFVGKSFDAATAKGATFTVTTTANSIATSIDAITVGDVKVGTPVTKELIVRNKHNEDITKAVADEVEAKIYKDGKEIDTKEPVTVTFALNAETKKYEAKFVANAEGDYTVRIFVEGSAAVTEVAVSAEKTELASIDLGKDIYDGVIAGDTDKVYQIITAKDNKGDKILADIPTGDKAWKVTKDGQVENPANVTVAYVAKDKDGNWTTDKITKENAEEIALVVTPKAMTEGKATYTVATADDKIKDEIMINVKEARKVAKITATPKSTTVGLGGKTTLNVTAEDQYGQFINLTGAEVTAEGVTAPKTLTELKEDKKDTNKVTGYSLEVTGNKVGTGSVTIEKKDTDGKTLAKETVSVNVTPAADIVKALEITADGVKDGKATHKLATAKATESDAQTIQLTAVGLDDAGNKVNLNQKEVVWSSSDKTVATVDKSGKVTAGTVEKDTEVTITADVFGVTQDITFVVSNEAAKVNPATVEVKDADKLDADKDKDGIQIVLGADKDEVITNGAITVTFTGVDQYGDDKVKFTPVANSKNATVATAKGEADNKVVITGVEAGETQIRVTVDAKEVALLDVKVTAENVVVKANAALAAAKAKVADLKKDDYTEATWQAVTTAQAKDEGTVQEKNEKAAALETAVKSLKTKAEAEKEAAQALATAKAELKTAIDTAKEIKQADEGVEVGKNIDGSFATLTAAISAAESTHSSATVASEANTAKTTLENAVTAYKVAKVTEAAATPTQLTIDSQAAGTTATTTVTVATGETLELVGVQETVATAEKVDATGVVTVTSVNDGTYTLTVQVKNASGKVVRTVDVTVTVSNQTT